MVGERRKLMHAGRKNLFVSCGLTIAAVLVGSTIVLAQEDDERPADEEEVIDEIIVVAGGRSGDPIDVQALYEEMMREKFMIEQNRLRVLEEEEEWRSSTSTTVENPSRIKWGYDLQDEMRMRRESDLDDVQWITTKPATIFRMDFD